MPKLGDLLLYKRSNQARPWHAAICIGNDGEYIDFYGWLKESKLENNALMDEGEIYYIPVEALNSNMKAFIGNNQTLLSHPIAHEEIKLDAFKNTFYQYAMGFPKGSIAVLPFGCRAKALPSPAM